MLAFRSPNSKSARRTLATLDRGSDHDMSLAICCRVEVTPTENSAFLRYTVSVAAGGRRRKGRGGREEGAEEGATQNERKGPPKEGGRGEEGATQRRREEGATQRMAKTRKGDATNVGRGCISSLV